MFSSQVVAALIALAGLIIIHIIGTAAAWGDMRRQVSENRQRQDERHEENQSVLGEIRDDVKRINGTVSRHDAVLRIHGEEIDRLRED